MGGRLRAEYLKEWKEKKLAEDPEYFKRAGDKANKKRRKFLQENPEIAKEFFQRARDNRKKSRKIDPRTQLLADARKRAKRKGMEYNLSKEDLIVPEVCPVLGLVLQVGDGKRQPNSPSIDRIDNSKGYIRGNVLIISLRANALKNDGTLEELRAIVKYMEENNGMVWDGQEDRQTGQDT
jgi:hypothetical protein